MKPRPKLKAGPTHGVWAIGPDNNLEPVPFREEVVDGERQVLLESADLDAAHERARVRAGRFGAPRAGRPSALAGD